LLVLIAAAIALLPGRPATAAARVTIGPYLQDATPTSMTLLWRTDSVAAASVEYRPAGGNDTNWLTATVADRTRTPAVTLSNLQPGTAYQYRIRADSDLVVPDGSFRTLPAPASDSLNFVVFGDNRTNHSPHADVVRQILKEQPAPTLLINTGDLVEHGENLEEWNTYFQIEHDLLAKVPIFPAIGNHEDNDPLYFSLFRTPSNGTSDGAGRWYSFDAGPAHFAALDVVFSDVTPGTAQYRWLDADLARSDRPFKFVFFHYPPYNASTPHGPNLQLRVALENMFIARKVTAVLTGHAHIYERAEGAGTPPLEYFVSGGSGAPEHTPGQEASTRYTEVSYHFLRMQIQGNRFTSVGVHADGSLFDRFAGQLNADGRLAPITTTTPVVVPGVSAGKYLGSLRGGVFLGYLGLMSVVAPLVISVGVGARRAPVVPVPSGPVHVVAERVADPYLEWRGLPVLAVAIGVAIFLVAVLAPTAPLQWLVGFDTYTVLLTLHGISGIAVLVVAAAAGNYGYRLATHRAPSFRFLAANVAGALFLSALTATLGNVLYARYVRSGGPMEQLIKKAPEAQRVLFEFKEFAGLVPLPLAAAAAFIVFRYREDLRRDRHLAELVALILLLLAFYCLFPLGLGASITRLRGIA
jgi:hypothetical protein